MLTRYDLLVLDEAQSIRFSKADEIQAQLKGYLEQGVYARGDCCATAECGLMLLANIDLQQQANRRYHSGKPMFAPARADFIRRLPETFLESPLVDRFHGIIPGWEIPPFETEQQAVGLGLKADYFAEVCHALRSASHLSQGVRSKLGLSGGKRDCTAVERMACGLAKLLLISPDNPRFEELVIRPAEELRRLVRTQLHALDAQGYAPELQIRRFGAVAPAATGAGQDRQVRSAGGNRQGWHGLRVSGTGHRAREPSWRSRRSVPNKPSPPAPLPILLGTAGGRGESLG